MKAPLFAKAEPRQPRAMAGVDLRQRQAVLASINDQRPAAIAQRKLQQMANQSPQALRLQACAQLMEQGKSGKEAKPIASAAQANGLPVQLKAGIEALSGMRMDHVRVHYNSPKPAQLKAHAFAQGNAIHLAPGQEQHLPHEAWHVVQQAQGRVRPTLTIKQGVAVNDDAGLEQEADIMGARALSQGGAIQQQRVAQRQISAQPASSPGADRQYEHVPVQRIVHKLKTARSAPYKNAISLEGIDPKEMREKMDDPNRHYIYDKEKKALVEVPAPDDKKKIKKSDFVLEHIRKSQSVRGRRSKINSTKLKRITGIFEVSKGILKKAKQNKGNKVNDLHLILKKMFTNVIDRNSNARFTAHFSIGQVHFSVNVANQSNLRTYKDLLAVTHVSLVGTKGKSSYASLTENNLYPTVGGGSEHFKYLYALESLRNHEFIPSLVLKSQQVEGDKIDPEDIIDPEKFGIHELSGAAGKDSDEFKNQRIDNTDRLLDEIDDDDDLKKKILTDPKGYEETCKDMCAIF
ncbi:DUF4157 domain-containing protein [Undibacterium sp. Ji49W]|uniref:eCIS core domain-containing protein n=1 Tax=Undibacterium sp. Ji49W TaxID=3413040 RepID=UPI003BF29BC5